jgi:16S rRNA (cytosine1402-N4)-methyltransferase
MLEEAIDALAPRQAGVYVDATLGGGGYTRAILGRVAATVHAFDRDPTAIERAREWAPAFGARLKLYDRPFAELEDALAEQGVVAIDGAAFDLGVSSMQLDEAERGFSFLRAGPLSLRMDDGAPDAADVVNGADAEELAAIFRVYGEERHARRIARAIVEVRAKRPIDTTKDLAEIVAAAKPGPAAERIHPATRVFQALRIFVNDELNQLARALVAVEKLLRPAGRLVVVTFHSLEDRLVKRFLGDRSGDPAAPSRHAPSGEAPAPTFTLLFRKPRAPTAHEVAENPRARSAKLRAAIRTAAAPRADFTAFAPPPLALGRPLQQRR